MQRATISVSEGRFPEARFDNRRTMEPSIGYALTRLRAQARALGTGIDVEVDDRGTRLSLTIDAEGRLRALPGSPTAASDPMAAGPDTSAPTQALPVTPIDSTGTARTRTPRSEASRDHRRTFTPDWGPAPALTPPKRRAQPRTDLGGTGLRDIGLGSTKVESAAPEPPRDGLHSNPEHSNPAAAPHSPQAESPSQARHRPRARPGRTGVIAALIVAALALGCAGLLLT